MKTAVSIPNSVFREADALAKKLGVSRSELYARALERLVHEHSEAAITEALNRIYDAEDAHHDAPPERAQFETLEREDW